MPRQRTVAKSAGPAPPAKRGIYNDRDVDHRKSAILKITLEHQKETKCDQRRKRGQTVAKP